MEELKDLNLMISEANRMANTFRAFEKIPKILLVLQSSSKLLKELDEEKTKKENDLANLIVKIGQMEDRIDAVGLSIKDKQLEFDDIEDVVSGEKKRLMELMEKEVAESRVLLEEELFDALDEIKAQIEENKEAVSKSEFDMVDAIRTHNVEIEKYKALEADYKNRADDAKEKLDKIKESLFGGAS